jgi:pimeloyl-ACP methyl ester carboxylesterase
MSHDQPASYKTRFIDLPLSCLHVMEVGEGEPLIIVPATISELENWQALVQFMAQWFHVFFFELPGHGQSEPFEDGFSSQRVAELVAQLADSQGFQHFNLMGFSFGGILAMRTYKLLSHRIDRLILIAPCLGHRALPLSPFRVSLLYWFNRLLSQPKVQALFCDMIHDPRTLLPIVKFLQKFGRLEQTIPLQRKLLNTPASTIEVLNAQLNEILTTEFESGFTRYTTPCYFAMSIHDPLLRFDTTLGIVHSHFTDVSTMSLTYPFHQPPRAFTYDELNRDFYETVERFMRVEVHPWAGGGSLVTS